MKSIRTNVFGIFFTLLLMLFVAAPAHAQTYYPGSVWTSNGSGSAIESGNNMSFTQAEQGIARGNVSLFASLTTVFDTAGYDWNRRTISGIGLRYSLPIGGGFVRVNAAYQSERRFVFPKTINGPSVTVEAWFGWQQSSPKPQVSVVRP